MKHLKTTMLLLIGLATTYVGFGKGSSPPIKTPRKSNDAIIKKENFITRTGREVPTFLYVAPDLVIAKSERIIVTRPHQHDLVINRYYVPLKIGGVTRYQSIARCSPGWRMYS